MKTQEKIYRYLQDIKPQSILDLGCGKGKILKKFFENVKDITGIDMQDFRESVPIHVKFIQEDIRRFSTERKFDLIIASMILHFLPDKDALEIIKRIKDNTSPGGYNFILCMSAKEKIKKIGNFYPVPEELKKIYSAWDIKMEEFETDEEMHDNLPPHKHDLIIFLAMKNKNSESIHNKL